MNFGVFFFDLYTVDIDIDIMQNTDDFGETTKTYLERKILFNKLFLIAIMKKRSFACGRVKVVCSCVVSRPFNKIYASPLRQANPKCLKRRMIWSNPDELASHFWKNSQHAWTWKKYRTRVTQVQDLIIKSNESLSCKLKIYVAFHFHRKF